MCLLASHVELKLLSPQTQEGRLAYHLNCVEVEGRARWVRIWRHSGPEIPAVFRVTCTIIAVLLWTFQQNLDFKCFGSLSPCLYFHVSWLDFFLVQKNPYVISSFCSHLYNQGWLICTWRWVGTTCGFTCILVWFPVETNSIRKSLWQIWVQNLIPRTPVNSALQK